MCSAVCFTSWSFDCGSNDCLDDCLSCCSAAWGRQSSDHVVLSGGRLNEVWPNLLTVNVAGFIVFMRLPL